jgi:Protein of unknown function (DUF2721)
MQPADFTTVEMVRAIQLAVAPVFLLSGIGVLLGVLTNRLARVIDRARRLESEIGGLDDPSRDERYATLRTLARRARHINRAIALSTIAALLVSLVVVLLFSTSLVALDLGYAVGLLFVAAMLALIGALLSFLLEVRIAVAALKFAKW